MRDTKQNKTKQNKTIIDKHFRRNKDFVDPIACQLSQMIMTPIYSKSKKFGMLTVFSNFFFSSESTPSSRKKKRCASDDIRVTSTPSFKLASIPSSVKKKVRIAEMADMIAHSIITSALPTHEAKCRKMDAQINAPSFPLAVHAPSRVDRHGHEKVMLGSMKVCTRYLQ